MQTLYFFIPLKNYNKKMKSFLYCIIVITLFVSCTKTEPVTNAVYVWNSKVSFSQKSIQKLQDLQIHKLYVHLFDIEWNKQRNHINPTAIIDCKTKIPNTFEYIPTIYITVECLYKSGLQDMPILADNIYKTVESICRKNNIQYKEIQIDCDWTPQTKQKYFSLIQTLSDTLHSLNKTISTTIRLHQIKYYKKTGIPQSDRGMLMFYNMGNISCNGNKNSIFNKEDAEKYIQFIRAYPLELDIALPLFSWGIICSNSHVIQLINSIDEFYKKHSKDLIKIKKNEYISVKSFLYKGMYITKGETITIEQITPETCLEAAEMISNYISPNKKRTISIFDYSSLIKENYEINSLKAIYNQFN